MVNLMTYAGSRGETLREFLNYAWKRTHDNQKCRDGTIDADMRICSDNPYHNPSYVRKWFEQRKIKA